MLDVLVVSSWSFFLLSVCKPLLAFLVQQLSSESQGQTVPGDKLSLGKTGAPRTEEQPHLLGADVSHRTLFQLLLQEFFRFKFFFD